MNIIFVPQIYFCDKGTLQTRSNTQDRKKRVQIPGRYWRWNKSRFSSPDKKE